MPGLTIGKFGAAERGRRRNGAVLPPPWAAGAAWAPGFRIPRVLRGGPVAAGFHPAGQAAGIHPRGGPGPARPGRSPVHRRDRPGRGGETLAAPASANAGTGGRPPGLPPVLAEVPTWVSRPC